MSNSVDYSKYQIELPGYPPFCPFEVESTIMELPYVQDCALKLAHYISKGIELQADVLLTPGVNTSTLRRREAIKKDIKNYVKRYINEEYKCPTHIELMQ